MGVAACTLCTVLKTKPPSRLKIDPLPDLAAHFVRRAEGKRLLRVDAAAPEGDPRAEPVLERLRIHARRRTLHRIEDVEAGVDEVVDQGHDRAAGVDERLPGGMLVDPVVDAAVERLVQAAIALGIDEGAGLRAEIGARDKTTETRSPTAAWILARFARPIAHCRSKML